MEAALGSRGTFVFVTRPWYGSPKLSLSPQNSETCSTMLKNPETDLEPNRTKMPESPKPYISKSKLSYNTIACIESLLVASEEV